MADLPCEICGGELGEDSYICDECGMTVCGACCDYDEERDYAICNDCKEEAEGDDEPETDEDE